MFEKIRKFIHWLVRFVTYDIWRWHDDEHKNQRKAKLYNITKVFILAVRNVVRLDIGARASALTYSTLLSIVPVLAVLFAIARGFGFKNIIQSELFEFFGGQENMLKQVFEFADQSLQYAQGGVFVGVGVLLLLYTVINLFSNVEKHFNEIWNVKNTRSYHRQFIDYFALLLIVPVLMICNSGISILIGSSIERFYLIGSVLAFFMKILPFFIIIFLFTFLYMYLPNTRVKFVNALIGGVVAGIVFQLFQMLYISGQIWIAKYNAIYGSFAALPLLLLWLQLSWYICLFGMLLTQASQNVKKFSFEFETKNISRRYKDFFTIFITSLIVKRFAKGDTGYYTADEISEKHRIPSKLTGDILYLLQQIGIVKELVDNENQFYLPAMDINKISVSFLFERLRTFGSEDFNKDWETECEQIWDTLEEYNTISYEGSDDKLLMDL